MVTGASAAAETSVAKGAIRYLVSKEKRDKK